MKKKVLCLLSGGIDSPVAMALLAKKYDVIPLHYCMYPFYCKGSFETTLKVLEKLKEKVKFEHTLFFPWAEVLSCISKSSYRKFMCVLCRRSMFKAAEMICGREGIKYFATGEALGQKASQTVSNLVSTSMGIKTEILRPLLSMDKDEIVSLAREMGIFMDVHTGCCNVTPYKPATKSEPEFIDKIFKEIGLEDIIKKNLDKMVKVEKLRGEKLLSKMF